MKIMHILIINTVYFFLSPLSSTPPPAAVSPHFSFVDIFVFVCYNCIKHDMLC